MATRARPLAMPALRLREVLTGGRTLSLGGADGWLLTDIAALCALGLVMVYSASEALGYLWFENPNYFFLRQLLGMGLGVCALVILARTDYHRFHRLTPAVGLCTVALLILVLLPHLGTEANGARRWFTIGPMSVQPSAIAILVSVLFFARWLAERAPAIRTARGVRDYGLLVGILLGLVLLERDLGSSIIIAGTALALLALGGVRKHHLLVLLGLVMAGGYMAIMLVSYRSSRVTNFTHPCDDPLKTGFQACQALYALGSGGFAGVGLGNSVQKYQWLPEAHTDFIFAIIGEELGLLGTVSVVLAFTLLLWRGVRASLRAPDAYGALLAGGITAWIGIQAFVNIGAVTGVIPTTGIPLPFISYGGTSLAVTLAGVGILCNVSAQGRRQGVALRAHVDRRRRDGRSPDAGAGSRPGAASS
ncbi:MAG: putative lipid II flippase FtsW [Candidatus Dormibacteraeota bacterium]|uniref:Probable peptidoglycan glycosyltransferase FtsW n=1 Tax=Candidatus Amunia macphersoniae TaxID=3127014 RepID=A0A934KDG8_9BACT|nr:putative lipid II flippase FtsW [Candidatus Dormibacteraeota bacterium]